MVHDERNSNGFVIKTLDTTMTLTCSPKDDRMGHAYAMATDPKDPLKFSTRRDANNFALAFIPHLSITVQEVFT